MHVTAELQGLHRELIELVAREVTFPARRIDLLAVGMRPTTPDWALEALSRVPDGVYGDANDVVAAVRAAARRSWIRARHAHPSVARA